MQGILHRTAGGRTDFELLDGSVIEGVQNISGAPLESIISARIEGERVEAHEVVAHGYRDRMRKHIALVRVVRNQSQVESGWNIARRLAREVEQYWRTINQIWETFEVRPFVVVDPDGPLGLSYNFQRPEIRDQLEAIEPDLSRFNYWCGAGGSNSQGYNGVAWTNSWKAWLYSNGLNFRVACHEITHMLGLEHDWAGGDAYGGLSIQGKRDSAHNSAALLYLGQITPDEVLDLDSGAAFLIPVECKAVDARPGEYRAVRVIRNNQINLLSIHRDNHQSPWGKGRLVDGHLWVHSYDPASRPSYRTVDYGKYADRVTLPNGAVVKVTGREGGVVRIAVDSDHEPDFPGWPVVPTGVHAMDETAAGLWYSPEYQYQGIRLHVRGTHVQGYWFTHLPEGGRVWLVLDGHISDGTVLLDVIRTDGRQQANDGEARLYLTGPDSGLLKVRCKTFGIDHLYLDRLAERGDQHPLTGLFETGEMEGVSSIAHGNDIQAYHFTYDASGSPDWEIYTGRQGDWQIFRPESIYKGLHGQAGLHGNASDLPGPMNRLM